LVSFGMSATVGRSRARRLGGLVCRAINDATATRVLTGTTTTTVGRGGNGGSACASRAMQRRWLSSSSKHRAESGKEATKSGKDGGAAAPENNPLSSVMFPWERAVLHAERWTGELKPWQKAYWAVFALGCAFVVGSRVKRFYDDADADENRREAMESNKRALHAAIEGRSFIAHSEDDDEEDPFDGLSPQEIEELVRKTAPSGDVYEGMTPEEINAYEENRKRELGDGNLTWKTSARE
jgi:hypothetical protein